METTEELNFDEFDHEFEITSIVNMDDSDPTIVLRHYDGRLTEVTFAPTGIGLWYKDAEYAEIDFLHLEKIFKGEEE